MLELNSANYLRSLTTVLKRCYQWLSFYGIGVLDWDECLLFFLLCYCVDCLVWLCGGACVVLLSYSLMATTQ